MSGSIIAQSVRTPPLFPDCRIYSREVAIWAENLHFPSILLIGGRKAVFLLIFPRLLDLEGAGGRLDMKSITFLEAWQQTCRVLIDSSKHLEDGRVTPRQCIERFVCFCLSVAGRIWVFIDIALRPGTVMCS